MGRVVAQQLEAVLGIAGNDLDRGIVFDAAAEIPQLAVDPDRDGIARQALRDIAGNLGPGYGIVEATFRPILATYELTAQILQKSQAVPNEVPDRKSLYNLRRHQSERRA
jgi:hypothetical protein